MTTSELKLASTDWDLLDALWTLGRATARQVTEHLQPTHGWAYSTVKTLLDRLRERELVHATQVGRQWVYSPAVERVAAQRNAWTRLVKTAFGGGEAAALRFVAEGASSLPADQREKLLKLLQDADQ